MRSRRERLPSPTEAQVGVCEEQGVAPDLPRPDSKLGVSLSLRDGGWPIQGLRHRPGRGTSGWYIWSGDYSGDPEFFVPLHAEHLRDWNAAADAFLALPPGFRFYAEPGRIDVWFDESLLADEG